MTTLAPTFRLTELPFIPPNTTFNREESFFEFVDGLEQELPPMSADSSVFASRLATQLAAYGIKSNLGEAYSEILLRLALPVDRRRRPDVIFIPYSVWSKNRAIPITNTWDVLPSLSVEVVSPNDLADEIRTKVEEYLTSGVRLVWVVYPRLRLVDVYEPAGLCRVVRFADILDGGDVLPGFKLTIDDIFPKTEEPEPTEPQATG